MPSAITGISYAVPEKRLTHSQLCERFGKGVMDKIARASGILERRVAPEGVCASDLAFDAAKLLIERNGLNPKDFDLLLMGTQTPDYMLPTTACILQDRLGFTKSCAAFDINLGCSQFIYALGTARAWIEAGMAKKALVLAGDTPTKLIHPMDRSAVSLFGDAACACIVEKTSKNSLLDFSFGSDGSGYADLICPTSGMRRRPVPEDSVEFEDADKNIRTNNNMFVDGFKIFSFAYKIIAQEVSEILKRNGLGVDDIDLFVFHQAGEMIVERSAKRIGIPSEKLFYKMHDIGNCGGSSVGIALTEAALSGRLKPGMKVVLCAFGVGLSWATAFIEWSDAFQAAHTIADYSESPARPKSQSL